ncbi:hypothetical protein [uncultured Acinetobacter sp.]|jgi:hypothetical protein|uniref:hypothetical protein n=1 Tax=uncultured Acinetobacter sp. TaxID=165433 RepID=UPI0026072CD1|nr:hypothetical protein [uncultured Acinetobacter sp.]
MPKRREPALAIKEASNTPTPAQIEAFAAGADGEVITQNAILDSDASRDFKAIRLPFNEYEYRQLEEASRRTGRSKLNFIRYAMLKMAAETNENI